MGKYESLPGVRGGYYYQRNLYDVVCRLLLSFTFYFLEVIRASEISSVIKLYSFNLDFLYSYENSTGRFFEDLRGISVPYFRVDGCIAVWVSARAH